MVIGKKGVLVVDAKKENEELSRSFVDERRGPTGKQDRGLVDYINSGQRHTKWQNGRHVQVEHPCTTDRD